jgi:ATP-dependent DNA helicase RecG
MEQLDKVKGIGNKGLLLLQKLGINNIDDLISYYPFRYAIFSKTDLNQVGNDDRVVVEGIIESIPTIIRFKGKMNKMTFRFNTNEIITNVAIFNRAFLKNKLKIGNSIVVVGKFNKEKNIITASDIKFETLGNSTKIEPIYHITNGLSNKIMNNYINHAIDIYSNQIYDIIPSYLKERYQLLDRENAIQIAHNPNNIDELKKAQITLKYEELFLFMLKINYLRLKNKNEIEGLSRDIDMSKVEGFIANLPFLLTFDQKKVIDEILHDLKEKTRMNRLLQGDVGSGKTIVAIIAMYANYLSGYQSALMAPTEILARQHYDNIKELFKGMDINVELLTGSTDRRQKKRIYSAIQNGETNIIIGTHALIQDELKFYNLGLVITDEQHRFGVNQRANLQNKGMMPDILYMSATPIPRTYALTIYGDMDISSIKTMPSGRKDIITYLKSTKDLKEILGLMWNELQSNHQIYVIAPLIEESEKTDLNNIYLLKEKMELAFGKKYHIDILYGKMDSTEKDKVMNQFLINQINILISTTVVEVGVNIPNATMIVIFDANHFGLSTLHQLRGRVGRSDLQSYAILISDSDAERLKIMEQTNDGFAISEADFNLRGHGDLFGIKQSGDMTFKIADLKKDFKILLQAKEDSQELLNNDLFYTSDEYKNIYNTLMKLDNLN